MNMKETKRYSKIIGDASRELVKIIAEIKIMRNEKKMMPTNDRIKSCCVIRLK